MLNEKPLVLDKRITIGCRVLIVCARNSAKKEFVGHTATVSNININHRIVPYYLKFDSPSIGVVNVYCWGPEEVVYLEDQSYVV